MYDGVGKVIITMILNGVWLRKQSMGIKMGVLFAFD